MGAGDQNQRRRLLRPVDRDVETLLNRIDAQAPTREHSRREHKRFPFRLKSCAVRIQQPGDSSPNTYIVFTRNLSAWGLSFVHGAFVHVGSRVWVQLITTHGSWSDLQGAVVNCRYIEQGVHEIAIRFDHEIQPSDFTAAALSYRILLADDDNTIARLAMHHLAMLNAEIERAVNGREAVEKALIKPFDVILMDMEMPEMNGWDAAKALREQGYSGRIYAMTALTSPEDHEKCLRTGCNAFYPKPATHSTYAEIVESLKEEPLTSVYHHQADLRDLIIAFVEEIPATIRTIEDTMRRSDSAGLEAALRSLKATAGGHGFDVISTSAAEAETALQLNKPMPEVQLLTQKVLHLCMLARAPERTATEAAEKDAKLKAEKDAEPKNEEKPAH